jgi:hypothetical protein
MLQNKAAGFMFAFSGYRNPFQEHLQPHRALRRSHSTESTALEAVAEGRMLPDASFEEPVSNRILCL